MNDPILQEIKDRLNVAEVIGSYIAVKRAGTAFKAVCPFHSDKNPSLMISPQKQIWHCFACGAGGDIFGFVMRFENVEFKEALKLLADKAGVTLPAYSRQNVQETSEKETLLKINNFAAQLYNRILTTDKRGKPALDYLHERGVTDATIKQWQIGFAPAEAMLEKILRPKKVSSEDLVKAGVCVRNERGLYDRFYGRITFPVYNYMGEAVGFSARILPGSTSPAKYVNSPETPVYHKSKVLFGLNFAKNGIRKSDEAIIVEGQMDCIMAHQAGFTNVVASSGTALTADQLQLVGRLTTNLKFCFDSDAAGIQATKRSAELYLGQDFSIKIISLPDAKDPADLILNQPKDFDSQVKSAKSFLDFYLEKLFVNFKDTVEEKKKVVKEFLPLLRFSADPVEQDHYIQLLAARLQTSAKVLWQALEKIKKPSSIGVAAPKSSVPVISPRVTATINQEKEILGGMLLFPSFRTWVAERAIAADFEVYEVRTCVEKILADEQISPGRLDQIIEESGPVAKEAIFMVESQLKETDGGSDVFVRQLEKSFLFIKLQSLKRSQLRLNLEIKKAESLGNADDVKDLSKKFAESSLERMKLEQLM